MFWPPLHFKILSVSDILLNLSAESLVGYLRWLPEGEFSTKKKLYISDNQLIYLSMSNSVESNGQQNYTGIKVDGTICLLLSLFI